MQTHERDRQHGGHDGEVLGSARGARGRGDARVGRGEEEDRGTAHENAAQVCDSNQNSLLNYLHTEFPGAHVRVGV